MKLARLTVTEPGTAMARKWGCTCPSSDGPPWLIADDCPLHPRPHAFDTDEGFRQARRSEDVRERERMARA